MKVRFLIPLFSALAAAPAQAIDFISTNAYMVAQDQTVAREQWVAANTVDCEGTFRNDLFATSGTDLKLNGIHEGNVWGIGSMLTEAGGDFRRNVRLMGRTLEISGSIGQNLMALGDTIVMPTNAVVTGDARLIGNSIVIEGRIDGDVSITASRLVTLGGSIAGNVEIAAPDILFSNDAHINGSLSYTAGKEIIPPAGAVDGTIRRTEQETPAAFSQGRLVSHGLWFLAALMAGIPFITLFPMTTAIASQLARKAPWKCLFAGMLASGALPVAGLVCVSSLVGVPLGLLVLASWGILLYLSRIVMALLIGTLMLRPGGQASAGRVVLSMALGMAVIYLATFAPALAFPVQLTVVWIGTGALLLALLQKRRLIIQVPQELKHLEELKKNQNNSKEESP